MTKLSPYVFTLVGEELSIPSPNTHTVFHVIERSYKIYFISGSYHCGVLILNN